MLLAHAARRLSLAEKLAVMIPGRPEPRRVLRPQQEFLLARIPATACGYENAEDLDHLRVGPAFKLGCGRFPEASRT